MTTFRFPLQRVLDWRRTQLEIEEARYKQQAAELAGLDRSRAEVEAEGVRSEIQVRKWNPVAGHDLGALDAFRRRVKAREAEIARLRVICAHKLGEQRRVMLDARRRCRLLERLEERRVTEWKAACDHELEELAGESYLAKWSREK
jgi:hypothetical protein